MIHSLFLINRHGKTRVTKWYTQSFSSYDRQKYLKEIINVVLTRSSRLCNFLEWNDFKVVYKKYASLYFISIVDKDDNELMILEIMHQYVESLDKFFNSVCELDLIFNFHKAYWILDEIVLAGHIQESSKKSILKVVNDQDMMGEEVIDGDKSKK